MAIVYIGGNQDTGETVTIPAHQTGDLILISAYREAEIEIPVPSPYTFINSSFEESSITAGFLVATSNSETSGTWTGSQGIMVQVYRSASGALGIGNSSVDFRNFGTTIPYPALTLNDTSGSSWVACFGGHNSNNGAVNTPPTGMVNRTYVNYVTLRAAGHDTSGGVASWAGEVVNVGGSGNSSEAMSIEITETASSVVIDDVTDPLNNDSIVTVNGSGFEAQGAGSSVTQSQGANSSTLSINTWSDTQVTADSLDIETTALYYGAQQVTLDADSGASANESFDCIPAVNNDYVQLVGVAVVGDRITAIPDLDGTEQLRYQAFLYQGASITPYDVIVNDDATFSISGATPDGNYSFQVRAYDFADESWGTVGTQSFTVDNGGIIPVDGGGMISPMKNGMISSMITKMIREES